MRSSGEEPRRQAALALDLDQPARLELVPAAQPFFDRAGDLDLPGDPQRFHARGQVDRVAPDVVDELLGPDHPGDHRPAVDSDPELHAEPRRRLDRLEARGQVEREVRHPLGVVGRGIEQATDDHVRVADGLDLLKFVLLHQVVEDGEHLVENRDQLVRRHRARHRGEPDDIREEQGHVVEPVGDERLAAAQPIGDRRGQDVQQQALVLPVEAPQFVVGRDIRTVDVDEPEFRHIHRQERVIAAEAAQLDPCAGPGPHRPDESIEQVPTQRPAHGATETLDQVVARRVGIDESAIPVDPEHRVRVLVRELHDRTLGGDVRPVDVEKAEFGDLDRAEGIRQVLGLELEVRAFGRGGSRTREPIVVHRSADPDSECRQDRASRGVGIQQRSTECDA